MTNQSGEKNGSREAYVRNRLKHIFLFELAMMSPLLDIQGPDRLVRQRFYPRWRHTRHAYLSSKDEVGLYSKAFCLTRGLDRMTKTILGYQFQHET